MSIFNLYPKVAYKVDSYDSIRAIDITSSVRIKDFFKNYRGISYRPYVVQDGERPDSVAHKFYGDSTLDWMVLLANDMYNIYEDWPKSSIEFTDYVIDKYGSLSAATGTVKYYYDSDNNIVDQTTYSNLAVADQGATESIYQWELRRNTNKSKIRLVSADIVAAIQSDLKSLLYKPIR
jgi:hypothetical protein